MKTRTAMKLDFVVIVTDGHDYFDRIGGHAGETAETVLARRFGASGLPVGWTFEIVLCR